MSFLRVLNNQLLLKMTISLPLCSTIVREIEFTYQLISRHVPILVYEQVSTSVTVFIGNRDR